MKFLIFTLFLFFTTVHSEDTDPLPCNCRLGNTHRIVNGKVAKNFFIPWMVILKTPSGFCAGSILNKKYIMTAANCTYHIRTEYISVYPGIHNLSEIDDKEMYKAKKIIEANFTFFWKDENFALIELDRPIEFVKGKIEPACLNLEDDDFEGELLTAGWGLTAGPWIDALGSAFGFQYPSKNDDRLKYFYGSQTKDGCTDWRICMKSRNEGDNVCDEDDGGPLMYTDNGRTFVVGIISHTDYHHSYDKLTFCYGLNWYARLKLYKELIDEHVVDYCTAPNISFNCN